VLAGACLPAVWAAEGAAPVSPYDPARRAAAEGRPKQGIGILDRLAAAGHRTSELYDLRAQLHLAVGDEDAAERDWRRAAQLDPTNVRSRLALGRLYGRRGLWGDAIAPYREVLLIDPRNADAVLGLADAYQKIGRTVGAQNLLEAAAEALDDRRIDERWVRVALAAGRTGDAEQALRRMVASSQGAARRDALLSLAQLYLSTDRPTEALTVAREALAIEKPAGAVTEATYDVIALAADADVEEMGRSLRQTLDALDVNSLTREEAFSALDAMRRRLSETVTLLTETGAPESRRSAQATRLYAYALADEAALNALTSVDLGSADQRVACGKRLEEAAREIRRLTPPPTGR